MPHTLPPLLMQPPDLRGQVVLITGGTGSIGRALVRRLLDIEEGPEAVLVLSRDEQKQHDMRMAIGDGRLRLLIGDIRDRRRLMRAFTGVDVVVHAAAMKHVAISEQNPREAIRTNVEGAVNVIDAAIERGVGRVVALSSDKACSPAGLYGATKLCMEKLFVAEARGRATRFDLVRCGNVIGTRGSVVPIFLGQRAGGRLTVTDPDMTRFWISMSRAVDLVLLALEQGRGGEVFVPRMNACTVGALAEAIAPDAEREITGAAPGEKAHESLITADEASRVVAYPSHFVVQPGRPRLPRQDGHAVPDNFRYTSAEAAMLGADGVRAVLQELGFL